MSIKVPYRKDQKLLGVFVEGLPKSFEELPKPVVRGKWTGGDIIPTRSYRGSSSPDEGIYSYNDMVNLAVDVLWSVNGVRVLVCPTCKIDVEPVYPVVHVSHARPDDVVLFHDMSVDDICAFASCSRCNIRFFIPELVSRKSFRLLLPNEDDAGYYKYLSVIWLKGDWRVLIGDVVVDAGDAATGETWV